MVGDIFQPTHLLFVLVIALLVLGPKRLPEVAKTLGKGIRDFRGAISGEGDHTNPMASYLSGGDSSPDHDETSTPADEAVAAPATPAAPQTAVPPTPAPVTDPQPVQPVDEPVQPIATPATTAPPPQPAPPQPAAAEPADTTGDTQVHPAASATERHE